jgi:mRNA interferase RelE/StbE
MDKYLKILKKLPKKQRAKVLAAIRKIMQGKLDKLDIKKLSDQHQLYRCRIGKFRILFLLRGEHFYVLDIGNRGDIYKDINKFL